MTHAEFRDFVAVWAGATAQREWRKCVDGQKDIPGAVEEHDKVLANIFRAWLSTTEVLLDYLSSKELMFVIQNGKVADDVVNVALEKFKKKK